MRAVIFGLAFILTTAAASAASDPQPPPAGAFQGAPPQFTRFSEQEISRGFLALAFGSDLRIGVKPRGIRRYDREILAYVNSTGSVERKAEMERIIAEYAAAVPQLKLSVTSSESAADLVVHLINEKDFARALEEAFGRRTARAFVRKTDPQCMTSVKSQPDGAIVSTVTFVIADQGDDVFLDCAYHELLHAFGLSNHDQSNPWTTLNQTRRVGYLTAYDRILLALLYEPRIEPGMTATEVRRILPELIHALPAR